MNAGELVTDCGRERQNRKLRAHVSGRVSGPINLRRSKVKAACEKVARNRRDIALPPAPVIHERLVNENQSGANCDSPDDGEQRQRPAAGMLCFSESNWRKSRRNIAARGALLPAHLASVLTASVKSMEYRTVNRLGSACMKSVAPVQLAVSAALALLVAVALDPAAAQNEPILVPDVVEYSKLIPILPDAPPGWTADAPEGATEDAGGFKITNVHRDYRKGEGDKAPSASISILDLAANPDHVNALTAAWKNNSETSEGYGKSVTIEGYPGFEAYEKEARQATLWLIVANRYSLQIELRNQEPQELQQWVKRLDLKKLSQIK